MVSWKNARPRRPDFVTPSPGRAHEGKRSRRGANPRGRTAERLIYGACPKLRLTVVARSREGGFPHHRSSARAPGNLFSRSRLDRASMGCADTGAECPERAYLTSESDCARVIRRTIRAARRIAGPERRRRRPDVAHRVTSAARHPAGGETAAAVLPVCAADLLGLLGQFLFAPGEFLAPPGDVA